MADRRQIEAVVSTAFDGVGISDVEERPSESYHDVRRVTLDSGREIVVKFCTDGDHVDGLRRDVCLHRFARDELDVPVPDVLAAGFSVEQPHYVAEACNGDWVESNYRSASDESLERFMYRVGSELAELHGQTEFERAGTIQPTGAGDFTLESGGYEWTTFVRSRLDERTSALQDARFEDVGDRVRTHVMDNLEVLEDGTENVLLHGDFGPANLFYRDDDVTGVVDWENAMVGRGEYDLCSTEGYFFDNVQQSSDNEFRDSLLAGYRSTRPLAEGFFRRRAVYRLFDLLYSLQTFESWAGEAAVDEELLADALPALADELIESI